MIRARPTGGLTAIVDEVAVHEALSYAKGNQFQAAALLGMSRTTLRAKLRGMGLSIQKQVVHHARARVSMALQQSERPIIADSFLRPVRQSAPQLRCPLGPLPRSFSVNRVT